MELRERVAKGAHEVLSRANVLAYLDMPDDTAFKLADAAIAPVLDALQEPSEGMVRSGLYQHTRNMPLADSYKAMLAAFRTEALPPSA